MGVDYREQYKPEHLESFFPHEIVKMIIVVLCTLALLMCLAILPTYLENLGIQGIGHQEDPADPATTPPHIRPEWYFLAVYQYLKLMPSEVLGIGGKALGILTQMVVVALLFLVPFWYPLRAARVNKNDWRVGLSTLGLQWLVFLIPAAVLLWFRNRMPDPYRDIIHPMFVWPVLWIAGYVAAGCLMRKVRLSDRLWVVEVAQYRADPDRIPGPDILCGSGAGTFVGHRSGHGLFYRPGVFCAFGDDYHLVLDKTHHRRRQESPGENDGRIDYRGPCFVLGSDDLGHVAGGGAHPCRRNTR
ncbi:MAG: hypothetical protein ACYTEK_02295 [Planctomycetota bacterium]|jgi:hypothetical protein